MCGQDPTRSSPLSPSISETSEARLPAPDTHNIMPHSFSSDDTATTSSTKTRSVFLSSQQTRPALLSSRRRLSPPMNIDPLSSSPITADDPPPSSPRYSRLLTRVTELEAALEAATGAPSIEQSRFQRLKEKHAATKAALVELTVQKTELEQQAEATLAKWQAHHELQVYELATCQQQAQQLAELPVLRAEWAHRVQALEAEAETYHSLYDVARQEAEQNKREFIAVVEDQAHAHETQLLAARGEADKWQARCRALEEAAMEARSRDEVLRQLERELDVSQAALRQSEAMAQVAEEGRERAEARIQRAELAHEAALNEWMAKMVAATSEKSGLAARLESFVVELDHVKSQLRERQHEAEVAVEEEGRLREALRAAEREGEEMRRQTERENEAARRAWQEEKEEWECRVREFESRARQAEAEAREAVRGALVKERESITTEATARQTTGSEVRRLQEEVARLEEVLEEERVRAIKVENDWKYIVKDLQQRQVLAPVPTSAAVWARSAAAAAPAAVAGADTLFVAHEGAAGWEERGEDKGGEVGISKEELEKVKLRCMLAIQKAERRAEAYKSKCLELHERWRASSAVEGM